MDVAYLHDGWYYIKDGGRDGPYNSPREARIANDETNIEELYQEYGNPVG